MEGDREAVLAVYRGQAPGQAVWQPRLYYWYYANRLRNRLPAGYAGPSLCDAYERLIAPHEGVVPADLASLSLLDVHRALGASPRYPCEVLGLPLFEEQCDTHHVRVSSTIDGPRTTTVIETPHGTLRRVQHHVVDREPLIKSVDDLRALRFALEHTSFRLLPESFAVAEREFGDDGPVQAFFVKSPFQRFLIEWAGMENAVYMIHDDTNAVEAFLDFVSEWDDQVYHELCVSPIPILNFGENLHAAVTSPALYRRYLLPYYQKRTDELHAAGKRCSIHADGDLKPILPLLVESGFDAIEAPTPKPQGDVTLEELAEAFAGRLIVQDGLPATAFLPSFPEEELVRLAHRLLELFWPRVIPGISDELPPGADIGRVQRIGEIIRSWRPGVAGSPPHSATAKHKPRATDS